MSILGNQWEIKEFNFPFLDYYVINQGNIRTLGWEEVMNSLLNMQSLKSL